MPFQDVHFDDGITGTTLVDQVLQGIRDYDGTQILVEIEIEWANVIIEAARSQLGVPYIFGTENPLGDEGGAGASFDCSGLTSWCYAQAGIGLPHSAAAQHAMSPAVSQADLLPGDLMFYVFGRLGGAVDHVAMNYGPNAVIHAHTSSRPVEISVNYGWGNFVGGGRPT